MMTGMVSQPGIAAQQARRGSVRYPDAETTQLSLPIVAPLPPNCIAQTLQNLHVEITSDGLSWWYELMVNHLQGCCSSLSSAHLSIKFRDGFNICA
jgi:hypothetical protein